MKYSHIEQVTVGVKHADPECSGGTGTVVLRLQIEKHSENVLRAECSRCGACEIVGVSHPVVDSPIEVTFRP